MTTFILFYITFKLLLLTISYIHADSVENTHRFTSGVNDFRVKRA